MQGTVQEGFLPGRWQGHRLGSVLWEGFSSCRDSRVTYCMARAAFNARSLCFFGNVWCIPVGHWGRRCRSELGPTGIHRYSHHCAVPWALPGLWTLSVALHRQSRVETCPETSKSNSLLIACSVCCVSPFFVPVKAVWAPSFWTSSLLCSKRSECPKRPEEQDFIKNQLLVVFPPM